MVLEPVAKTIGRGYTFAIYGPLLVQIWQTSASLEAAQTLRRFTQQWAGQIKLILAIVEAMDQMPAEPVRLELAGVAGELASPVSMIVYDGTGFKAAALRAVVTGIFALSGHRHTMKVFSSLREAVEWERGNTALMPALTDLEPQIASLRAELSRQAATQPFANR